MSKTLSIFFLLNLAAHKDFQCLKGFVEPQFLGKISNGKSGGTLNDTVR